MIGQVTVAAVLIPGEEFASNVNFGVDKLSACISIFHFY